MLPIIGDKTLVFIGPTAHGIDAEETLRGEGAFTFFPPIRRGDLLDLPACFGTIVIVDGLFHSTPAVGHIEIRNILGERTVYGCSSIGAIRAYEMREMGMKGFGEVYQMFLKFEEFDDDEVTQLHGPSPDYEPISEPLVNIRVFLDELVSEGELTLIQSRTIVGDLKKLYFGDRTITTFGRILSRVLGETAAVKMISKFPQRRIKTQDFLHLMKKLCHQ